MKDLLALDGKQFDYKQYLGPAKDMTLQLDFSPKNQKKADLNLLHSAQQVSKFLVMSVQNRYSTKRER